MAMTPERWERIESLLDAALDLPAAERGAFLDRTCADDASLRTEVERLLAAHESANGPLPAEPGTASAVDYAEPLIADVGDDGHDAMTPAPVLPDRIGAWQVIAPIGAGGMGSVWLVERADGVFRMRAALKLVRRGLHFDAQFVRRFHEERQILARLEHPGVARAIDGGVTADGLPYFVMEHVAGEPIDRWCDERSLPLDARLTLFAKVCDIVAAAHRLGIVHRDLKPSNVLVTAEGEPKLLDFGIARSLAPWDAGADDAATPFTRTGERLLTPEYASPEQLRGHAPKPATDVYSLGVLLYELLTGRRPHAAEGRARHELDRAVLEEPVPRPSWAVTDRPSARPGTTGGAALAAARGLEPAALRQRLRGDLDAIVLMALRKEPERRYATAADLAADVRRYLDGRAIVARGEAVTYRVGKWLGRHRRLVAAATLGMLTGATALALVARRTASPAQAGDRAAVHGTVAHRYYEDGMRAYAAGNWADALRSLGSAAAEDSTFALAALYASEAAGRAEDFVARDAYMDRAIRYARVAPLREGLIVRAAEAYRQRLPALRAYADSLLALDPDDLEAQLADARADFTAGDFLGMVARSRRIAAADSAALRQRSAPCYACQALMLIVDGYMWADSLDAAVREAITLTELLPDAASSWRVLATVTQRRGDPDESAYRRSVELDPGDNDYAAEWLAEMRMRQSRFHEADAILRARLETAPPRGTERALWTYITSLRNQERWEEALAAARRFRALNPDAPPGAAPAGALHEAQVLMESGRPGAAAALYDSIARFVADPARAASVRIWHLAHRADALAAARDTAELGAIADTMRALAPFSGYGRDMRLENHVRGLLYAARGDDAAAERAFRAAIYSWTHGYTRTNLELARVLLRAGRPAEARSALEPALHGSLEVNNLYVTHTELHRALAEAWRAEGRPDSARLHLAWVARAVVPR